MPQSARTQKLHRCPKCHRKVRPRILEFLPAFKKARPEIPARLRVRCAAIGCGHMWYLMRYDDED